MIVLQERNLSIHITKIHQHLHNQFIKKWFLFVSLLTVLEPKKHHHFESLENFSGGLDDDCHNRGIFDTNPGNSNFGAICSQFISTCTDVVYHDDSFFNGFLF
jgi:hypothetical protein